MFKNSIRIQIFIMIMTSLQVELLEPLSLSPGVLSCLDDVPRGVLQVRSAAAPPG